MGSSGEYGRSKSPQKENINCRPISTYNRAKFLATKYLINLYRKKNFLLRPFLWPEIDRKWT